MFVVAAAALVLAVPPASGRCTYEGKAHLALPAQQADFEAIIADGADTHAAVLSASDGGVRIDVDVSDGGWHLSSSLGGGSQTLLTTTSRLALDDNFIVAAGAAPAVVGVDATGLTVALPPHAFDDVAIELRRTSRRTVPCDTVAIGGDGFTTTDAASPAAISRVVWAGADIVDARGVAVAHVRDAISVNVVDGAAAGSDGFTTVRVDGNGASLVGRVSTRALHTEGEGYGSGEGGLGNKIDHDSGPVCSSPKEASVFAANDGRLARIGRVAANTPFLLVGTVGGVQPHVYQRGQDVVDLQVQPVDARVRPPDGVAWLIAIPAQMACSRR